MESSVFPFYDPDLSIAMPLCGTWVEPFEEAPRLSDNFF